MLRGYDFKSENGAYACRLKQIQSYLASLPVYDEGMIAGFSTLCSLDLQRLRFSLGLPSHASPLFWLDILCIPAKNLSGINEYELLRLRKEAISQIPVVFAGAAQTLVRDDELQSLRLAGSRLSEIMTGLRSCQWASRAWTYQEGLQSMTCRVQLADGAFNPVDDNLSMRSWHGFVFGAVDGLKRDTCRGLSIHMRLEKYLLLVFQNEIRPWFSNSYAPESALLLEDKDNGKLYARGFVRTWNELLLRSATDVDDLVIILAMALQLPMHNVLMLPPSQRLQCTLWSLDRIPLTLLFIPRAVYSADVPVLNS